MQNNRAVLLTARRVSLKRTNASRSRQDYRSTATYEATVHLSIAHNWLCNFHSSVDTTTQPHPLNCTYSSQFELSIIIHWCAFRFAALRVPQTQCLVLCCGDVYRTVFVNRESRQITSMRFTRSPDSSRYAMSLENGVTMPGLDVHNRCLKAISPSSFSIEQIDPPPVVPFECARHPRTTNFFLHSSRPIVHNHK